MLRPHLLLLDTTRRPGRRSSSINRGDAALAWIAELRARLDRGDLATLGPIDFGDGFPALPAEHTVGIMLADLGSFEDMDPDEANDPVNAARRASLLADFRVLRRLID